MVVLTIISIGSHSDGLRIFIIRSQTSEIYSSGTQCGKKLFTFIVLLFQLRLLEIFI